MITEGRRVLAERWIKDAEGRLEKYAPGGSVDTIAAIASLAVAHALLATLRPETTKEKPSVQNEIDALKVITNDLRSTCTHQDQQIIELSHQVARFNTAHQVAELRESEVAEAPRCPVRLAGTNLQCVWLFPHSGLDHNWGQSGRSKGSPGSDC